MTGPMTNNQSPITNDKFFLGALRIAALTATSSEVTQRIGYWLFSIHGDISNCA
jgi:hypothetical protein